MKDLEEAAKKIRLLAEVVGKIEGTAPMEDAAVQAEIELLGIEMSSYRKQLSALNDLLTVPDSPVITRPGLYLVKG